MRVTDKLNHPKVAALNPTNLQAIVGKPTVGVPYFDASFGTLITRIAEPAPDELPENAIIKPMYSTMQAWNADESLLLLWHREKGHELYLGDHPYTYIGNLGIAPTDIEHVIWDNIDPFVLYYPTRKNGGRCQLIKVVLKPTFSESVLFDFTNPPVNCPINAPNNRFGLGADPEINLGPRKIIGLMGGSNGQIKIIYSIAENKVLVFGPGPQFPNVAPIVSPSEQFVFLNGNVNNLGLGGFIFDINLKYQRRLTAASYFEHSQIGQDLRGDTWNAIAFNDSSPGAGDSGTLVSHSLVDGSRKVIIGPTTGYPYIASTTHISTTGPAGLVLVSSVGGAHDGSFMGDNEIMLANTDTGVVQRVGHCRSWAGSNCGPAGDQCPSGYWGETHGVLSRKGDRILFGSDGLGFTGLPFKSVDPYIIDLRKPNLKMRFKTTAEVTTLVPPQTFNPVIESYEIVGE